MSRNFRYKHKRHDSILKREVWSLQTRDARSGDWIESLEVDTLSQSEMSQVVKVLNTSSDLTDEQRAILSNYF